MNEPEDRWNPGYVEVIPIGGPERVYDDKPTTEVARPIGFAPTMPTKRERVTAALAPLGPDADQFVQAVMEAIEESE